jgi:very-short-patch-repair endonuclease
MNPEHDVQGLARRQQGLVTRQQALAVGMTDHEIKNRAHRGWWQLVYPGVYLLGVSPPIWEQRLRAATLAAGPTAVASHRAAAILWQLDGFAGHPIEITIPHRREATLDSVRTYRSRTLGPAEVTAHRGIPVTVVERTLLDLGRHHDERTIEVALESALRKGLTTNVAVTEYLGRTAGRVPGRRVLERVLRERGPARHAGSPAEAALLQALRAAGVPTPERQYRIDLGRGQVATVDIAWPPQRVVLEVDGYDFHGGRQAHAADLERQNALTAAGWMVLRYSGSTVARDPGGIVRQVTAVLAQRGFDAA